MSDSGRAPVAGAGSGENDDPASVVVTIDRDVVLLEVAGSFPSAAAVVNTALRRALFQHPLAVICDLTAVDGSHDAVTLARLADTGGYLESWPGCRLTLVEGAERDYASPPDARLLVTESRAEAAVASVDLPARRGARVQLAPDHRASRIARDFVTRTCLDWRLVHGISSAVLVVDELVLNSVAHAATDIEVTLSSVGPRLLLAVHDGSRELPRLLRGRSGYGRGRGLHLVAGFSHAWGSLPGPDGGKMVWAVIDA